MLCIVYNFVGKCQGRKLISNQSQTFYKKIKLCSWKWKWNVVEMKKCHSQTGSEEDLVMVGWCWPGIFQIQRLDIFNEQGSSPGGGMIGNSRMSHQPGKIMPGEDDTGIVLAGGQIQEDLAAGRSHHLSQLWENGCWGMRHISSVHVA